MNYREAGIHESGSDSLICDLILAAVVLPSSHQEQSRRKDRFNYLLNNADVGIGRVTAQEVDQFGLQYCRKLLLDRAINNLMCPPQVIVVHETFYSSYKHPNMVTSKGSKTLTEAEFLSKYLRDLDIDLICSSDPDLAFKYGWKTNRGFVSDVHRRALVTHGRSKYHRLFSLAL